MVSGIPSISLPTLANRNLPNWGRSGRKDRRNVIATRERVGDVAFVTHGSAPGSSQAILRGGNRSAARFGWVPGQRWTLFGAALLMLQAASS